MEEHKIVMRNSFHPYPLSHLDGFEPLAKLEKNRKPGKGLEREQFVIHILFSGIRSGMLSSNDSPEKKGAPTKTGPSRQTIQNDLSGEIRRSTDTSVHD